MAIATGVVLGLLIIIVGSALAQLLGLFLLGLTKHLTTPARVKPRVGFLAGALLVIGLILQVAGPLASLWGGIATFVHFLGA